MSFGFLNAVLLLGLLGAALPILVHLLSRRNYDVVPWGAMQFLELGRRTRRRIRLEELLLLLLRIGLIALLALALARPWIQGGIFSRLGRSNPRDVAVVIDGSYSMGWQGDAVTPHNAAVQWTHELLERLGGEDTVTVLDARDRVRVLSTGLTQDFAAVRKEMDAFQGPSGSSSLPTAAVKALEAISNGRHLDRDVILLTDDQAVSWSLANGAAWRRFEETVRRASPPPRVWVVDVAGRPGKDRTNFSVDRLRLSREMTVPGFPLSVETTIRQWGGGAGVARREVSFAVNGQRVSGQTMTVNLPPNGEAPVRFEHRFDHVGSHLVSVILEQDDLPGDDRADAAILVESGLPVLLVDGSLQRDTTRNKTFFLNAALTPAQSDAPWVRATVIDADRLTAEAVAGQRVVVLANVSRLSDTQVGLLRNFVAAGGGLIVAPGDRVDPKSYNNALSSGEGLLPGRLLSIKHEADHTLGDVNITSDSLRHSWLSRFQGERGVDLTEARFAHWWRIEPETGTINSTVARGAQEASPTQEDVIFGEPSVAARLDTGDPFILTRTYGAGAVILLAAPLDSDWSTLPSKNDFVPLVHEMIFHLASQESGRNVEPGTPIAASVPADAEAKNWVFLTPEGTPERALVSRGANAPPRLILENTELCGVYRLQPEPPAETPPEYFVVQCDRRESDLTPLSAVDRARLSTDQEIRFVSTLDEITAGMAESQPPREIWQFLLLAVLALLAGEVLLTRRLVQGGHEFLDAETPGTLKSTSGDFGP